MAKAELDIAELVKETFEKHFGVTLDRLRELAESERSKQSEINRGDKIMNVEQAIAEIEQSGLYGNQVHQSTMEAALSALYAYQDATKLIATMRNNKKAALWLKKYGHRESTESALEGKINAQ